MSWLKRLWPKSVTARVLLVAAFALSLYLAYNIAHLGRSLFYWRANIWVASYLTDENPDPEIPDDQKHLIFVMVDHYEHGGPKHLERGARDNDLWCNKFQKISDANRDDYGNRFRYTWFYPYDHHNDAIMRRLSQMAYDGYGEIEMHWHLSGANNDNYASKLREALEWYRQFGAMVTVDDPPKTAFAYIAGNWDLDASRHAEKAHGVTNQIQVLNEHGCYADFTFSTLGTPAQPSKVNSIYYVEDDPDLPKSHDTGIDAQVGKPVSDRLMIFEGPISITWNGGLDCADVERDPRFRPERISKWINANIHVHGRPEWVFVKVYSHGAQSKEVVLAHDMEWMLGCLKEECARRGITLHYMTAREAYNVVKAAEAGKTGDPEDFRDFEIGKYRNMVEPVVGSVARTGSERSPE